MKVLPQFAKLAAIAVLAVALVAVGVGVVFCVLEAVQPSEFWKPSGAFRAGLYATFVLGIGPALLLGLPIYWWLRETGRASWFNVAAGGGAPGLALGLFEQAFLSWGVACGILVACFTHAGALRWLGPNNSSKPTPLRGAA